MHIGYTVPTFQESNPLPASSVEAWLNLISDKQYIIFVTDLPHSFKITLIRYKHTGLSLYGLHHERTHIWILTSIL